MKTTTLKTKHPNIITEFDGECPYFLYSDGRIFFFHNETDMITFANDEFMSYKEPDGYNPDILQIIGGAFTHRVLLNNNKPLLSPDRVSEEKHRLKCTNNAILRIIAHILRVYYPNNFDSMITLSDLITNIENYINGEQCNEN